MTAYDEPKTTTVMVESDEACEIIDLLADHGIQVERPNGDDREEELASLRPAEASLLLAEKDGPEVLEVISRWRDGASPLYRMSTLQRHSYALKRFLVELGSVFDPYAIKEGEEANWMTAAEWLDLAAGVDSVTLYTAAFDDCLHYCQSVLDYEDARSEILSKLVTQLTVFNFVWSAFETTAKLLDLPRARGADGIVNRAITFLKSEQPIPAYRNVLDLLGRTIEATNAFHIPPRIPDFLGFSGLGLDAVRHLRNTFAHGTARLPEPPEWGGEPYRRIQLVRLSTRILLLTIQMLLGKYLREHECVVAWPHDAGTEGDASAASQILHLKDGSEWLLLQEANLGRYNHLLWMT